MEDLSNLEYYDSVDAMLKNGDFSVGFYNKHAQRGVEVYVLVNYGTDGEQWLNVDYERHYVNNGYNYEHNVYNTLCGVVVIDNASLIEAIEASGVSQIDSISVSFTYYDVDSDTYLSEILTIYIAE